MCSQLCLRQRVSVVTRFLCNAEGVKSLQSPGERNDSLHGRDHTFSPIMWRLRRLASIEKSRFHKVTIIVSLYRVGRIIYSQGRETAMQKRVGYNQSRNPGSLWPVRVSISNAHTGSTATLQAATLSKPRFGISCTCMKWLPHVREPNDIGSINHKDRVGNHIFTLFSHLEALTRTLGNSLPGSNW